MAKDAAALSKITQAIVRSNQAFTARLLALHVEEG
jgi:hypothetical protein